MKEFSGCYKAARKRDALDVVPVKVREKDVRVRGRSVLFHLQLFAQVAESSAAIEDVDMPIQADFNTGRVTAITQILGLWGWC